MTTNIEKMLMKDELFRKHILGIYPSSYTSFPKRTYLPEVVENKCLGIFVKWMEDNLKTPLIRDDFALGINEGEKDRNAWQIEIGKKYEDNGLDKEVFNFINDNKLKGNCYGKNFMDVLEVIKCFLGEKYPILNEKITESEEWIKYSMGPDYYRYKKMSLGQKIRFVRKAEKRVYEILESISIKE